jgi:hypothetical protein
MDGLGLLWERPGALAGFLRETLMKPGGHLTFNSASEGIGLYYET